MNHQDKLMPGLPDVAWPSSSMVVTILALVRVPLGDDQILNLAHVRSGALEGRLSWVSEVVDVGLFRNGYMVVRRIADGNGAHLLVMPVGERR